MTFTVVSTPASMVALTRMMLPSSRCITGGERTYHLYTVSGRDCDFSFIDPTDGELLVECRCFDDEPAARQWVAADIALRSAQTGRVQ
jgi:hypothetical protein